MDLALQPESKAVSAHLEPVSHSVQQILHQSRSIHLVVGGGVLQICGQTLSALWENALQCRVL